MCKTHRLLALTAAALLLSACSSAAGDAAGTSPYGAAAVSSLSAAPSPDTGTDPSPTEETPATDSTESSYPPPDGFVPANTSWLVTAQGYVAGASVGNASMPDAVGILYGMDGRSGEVLWVQPLTLPDGEERTFVPYGLSVELNVGQDADGTFVVLAQWVGRRPASGLEASHKVAHYAAFSLSDGTPMWTNDDDDAVISGGTGRFPYSSGQGATLVRRTLTDDEGDRAAFVIKRYADFTTVRNIVANSILKRLDGLTIFDRNGNGEPFAVDTGSGKKLWSRSWPESVSVLAASHAILVTVDYARDVLQGWDTKTGKLRWTTPWEPVTGAPAVIDETAGVLVPPGYDDESGYDLTTGRRLWTITPDVKTQAIFGGSGRIYFLGGNDDAAVLDSSSGKQVAIVPLSEVPDLGVALGVGYRLDDSGTPIRIDMPVG